MRIARSLGESGLIPQVVGVVQMLDGVLASCVARIPLAGEERGGDLEQPPADLAAESPPLGSAGPVPVGRTDAAPQRLLTAHHRRCAESAGDRNGGETL